MATSVPAVFRGSVITFDSGFCAGILDFSFDGYERAMINKSTSDTTTAHEYMVAAIKEPGSFNVTLEFDATDQPPMDNNFETVAISWGPAGDPSIWTWTRTGSSGGGALSGFSVTGTSGDSDDKMTATAVLKLSGNVSFS